LAEEAPLALAIDDLHWADNSSLRFLQFVLPRLEELPILVATAARPSEPSVDSRPLDAIATDALTRVLRPAPLGEDAVTALVAGALGGDPDPRFCEACREATGGNPFLLRELLRELVAEGVMSDGDVSLVRQLAPPTVARAVLLRLARLGADATAIARAVAVLGDGTPLRRAAALAELSEARAGESAARLAQVDILDRARPLSFAHPILRAAIYADLDPGERSRLHSEAAALLAKEGEGVDAIAVHLLPTEPAGDPSVVETLREAATRALARGASPTAVACLQRALSEPPPADMHGSVVLELAAAELRAGETAAASEHFSEGLRVSKDPRLRATYAAQQGLALAALGRRDEAFALGERIVDETARVDRELALLLEADVISTAAFEQSRLEWVRGRLERYRGKLSGATQGERMLMATQAHLDVVFSQQPAKVLADAAERALASGRLLDETAGTSATFFQAIDILLLADRLDPARWELDRALDRARRRGSAPVFAFASGWRCWLMAREGNLAEAEADGRSCAEVSMSQGWFEVVPLMLGNLLDVLVDRGELDDADRLLRESGMYERPADDYRAFDRAAYARMRLLIACGDIEAARTDFCALALRNRDERFVTYPGYMPAALVAPALVADDPDAARAEAQRTLHDAKTWDTPRAIGMAIHAVALVEEGARRLELLEEASSVLESSPARLEHARALADLGAALRRANHRTAAREPLRQALDIAEACGARRLADRARHELRAAGARPRRPRTTGADALTASERRIAVMAAEGLSNPEIAQALFVTKKTVESHLSNAYRKLDISSRKQLSAALVAKG
jgi:DNA-binding CsgD family transcriptional regulator